MLKKLWQGNREKYARWRDEKGNFAGLGRLLRNGSRACLTGAGRISLGVRPELPWISYDAIAVIKNHLTKKSKVLEFGSGMSTLWYAKQAGEVFSVDDDTVWYGMMSKRFQAKGISNVHYQLSTDPAEYASFGRQWKTNFDLIMVDGFVRPDCIENSLSLLASKGIIYLDNSDKGANDVCGDVPRAVELLTEFAKANQCEFIFFTDFAPTQFFAQQGMLIRKLH